MNTLLAYTLYLYLLSSTSGVANKRGVQKPGLLGEEFHTKNTTNITTTSESSVQTSGRIGKKEIKYILTKMLLVAKNKNNCHCNCSDHVHTRTTEKNIEMDKITNSDQVGIKIRNKPEKYSGINNTLSEICPYFVPNEGFKMHKMVDVFWPKFYNMKENLNCFKITVLSLTDVQRRRNALMYGTFGGKVDWTRCHFEIKPPDSIVGARHFLVGDANDKGVMRNILVTTEEHGEYSFQEDVPDQWLMLRNMVLLRDCGTGEVVVFTRSPQMTRIENIVQALQDLGEEMVGKMLCDEDEDWIDDMP